LTKVNLNEGEITNCLDGLWQDAFRAGSLEAIFALLNVTGMKISGWEALVETEEAFKDYNWFLKAKSKSLSKKSSWRIGLLMYCHACEISAVHNSLKNLLNIKNGQPYRTDPFIKLARLKKNRMFKGTPPSATIKWNDLKTHAEENGNTKLFYLIESIYNDQVRNAFSHSDYIITEDEFRWTEVFPGSMPLSEVGNLISNSFVFFPAMINVRKSWLSELSKRPRYFPMQNFDVLELLKSDGVVNGLKIHFSTGTFAEFQRTSSGVQFTNFVPLSDSSLQYMVGDLDEQKNCYVVDGIQYNYLRPEWTDYLDL
jgi:hypothetical protein